MVRWRSASKPWYCVQTLFRSEDAAARELTRQSFEVFSPTVIELSPRSKAEITRPLFPCYIFVSFDLLLPQWRRIPYMIGVKRLMSANAETPLELPTHCIEDLQARAGPEGVFDARPYQVPVGTQVQVHGEMVRGWGEVYSYPADKRVVILMQVLGGLRKVELSTEDLVTEMRAKASGTN